jgi:hypothetical protein
MKVHAMGAEKRMDKQDESDGRFSQFCKNLKKKRKQNYFFIFSFSVYKSEKSRTLHSGA